MLGNEVDAGKGVESELVLGMNPDELDSEFDDTRNEIPGWR